MRLVLSALKCYPQSEFLASGLSCSVSSSLAAKPLGSHVAPARNSIVILIVLKHGLHADIFFLVNFNYIQN